MQKVGASLKTIMTIMTMLTGVSLVVAILSSKSSSDALSGLIHGSNNNNYYSKNIAKTKDKMLEKFIYINGLVFMGCVVLTNIV